MRREYDFEYDNTDEFAQLVNSINAHKTAYGGSDMYIELARKFDNSDYQWVCYRNKLDSDTAGSTATTGYFVLFDKSGTVIKDVAFSYPFLAHGITQCSTSGSSSASYSFKHIFLFFLPGFTN